MLLEHYDVYVVCPAPTNDHAALAQWADWVEQYLNAPAYDRIVFCNRRQLLLGDYLITRRPCDGFMGTVIRLGSDEFKTWEEVITFFSRLGGQ